ncbi:MAG: TrmH family RNA methyltransferase [Acidobacteriota bacterium]
MPSQPRPSGPPPAVVLVRPREEGNIGSVARAMANMGLGELILVEPAPDLGGVARGFGVGGWETLDASRRAPDLGTALAPFQCAVGTSSARERPRAAGRALGPRELAATLDPAVRTALVFGPEDNGLSRAELALCDPVVVIPCAPEHPTLNLAQAVLVVAYELFVSRGAETAPPAERALPDPEGATVGDLEALLAEASPVVRDLGFDHPHIHAGLIRDLRSLGQRARLDPREAGLLRRLLQRARRRLGEGD